jgi:hypothetical protein
MRVFMFLCPNTGYIVHGQADDAVPGEKPHTFHLVSCASCGGNHLVDPMTGEVADVESGESKSSLPTPTNRQADISPWRSTFAIGSAWR